MLNIRIGQQPYWPDDNSQHVSPSGQELQIF